MIEAVLARGYEDSATSFLTIKYCTTELKPGHTRTFDGYRPGRPNVITTSEITVKLHDIAMNDRRVILREIAVTGYRK